VRENEQNHQGMTDSEQYGQSWCSPTTSHQKDDQDNYQNQHACVEVDPR